MRQKHSTDILPSTIVLKSGWNYASIIQRCTQYCVRVLCSAGMASAGNVSSDTTNSQSTSGQAQSSLKLKYRPKPYRTLKEIAEERERTLKARQARAESDSKENIPSNANGWLSSRRVCVAPEFVLDPIKDAPDVKDAPLKPRVRSSGLLKPFKQKRYCCNDCYKWYHDPRCSSEEVESHIQRTARHRQPRSNTPPGAWDIDFPDDSD